MSALAAAEEFAVSVEEVTGFRFRGAKVTLNTIEGQAELTLNAQQVFKFDRAWRAFMEEFAGEPGYSTYAQSFPDADYR